MPLFALSLAPTVAASAFAHAPGQLALLSLLNALVSGGDVLAILLVVAQVPSAAIVRRESDATLWKMMPALQ